MDKVLLVIGDASEVLDTMIPYYRLGEEYQVVVAGPERRRYHMVLHERSEGWDITEERPGYHLNADIAFRDVRPAEYVGLVISGGRAPEYLRYNHDLMRITRSFFETGKPVACVCHGIEIVAAADVIRGKPVTTVAKCRYDAELAGAAYLDQPVVVSGNLVTARTWHDSSPWMSSFVRLLNEYVCTRT
jgi:protease I